MREMLEPGGRRVKIKELKEYLKDCDDNLEFFVLRDGDIPDCESHKTIGLFEIPRATKNCENIQGVYLNYQED